MAQDVPFQRTKIAVQENKMTQNEAKFGWEVKPKQQVLCMLCSPIAFWITYSILDAIWHFGSIIWILGSVSSMMGFQSRLCPRSNCVVSPEKRLMLTLHAGLPMTQHACRI